MVDKNGFRAPVWSFVSREITPLSLLAGMGGAFDLPLALVMRLAERNRGAEPVSPDQRQNWIGLYLFFVPLPLLVLLAFIGSALEEHRVLTPDQLAFPEYWFFGIFAALCAALVGMVLMVTGFMRNKD